MNVAHVDGQKGFTLIELSIVLVIIGLIVGGVLAGRELIEGARIRSQISQIETYRSATNTFRVKYNYLPGDIPDSAALPSGFVARGAACGQGDGNGRLYGGGWSYCLPYMMTGELLLFWRDLSEARLIDGSFTATTALEAAANTVGTTALSRYLPSARIGNGNFVYVFNQQGNYNGAGKNHFGIALVSEMWGGLTSTPGLSVSAAYNIDVKTDDGMPFSGQVTPTLIMDDNYLADGTNSGSDQYITANGRLPYNKAGTANSCYDNRNDSTRVMEYSVGQNSGNGLTCALSFAFQ